MLKQIKGRSKRSLLSIVIVLSSLNAIYAEDSAKKNNGLLNQCKTLLSYIQKQDRTDETCANQYRNDAIILCSLYYLQKMDVTDIDGQEKSIDRLSAKLQEIVSEQVRTTGTSDNGWLIFALDTVGVGKTTVPIRTANIFLPIFKDFNIETSKFMDDGGNIPCAINWLYELIYLEGGEEKKENLRLKLSIR